MLLYFIVQIILTLATGISFTWFLCSFDSPYDMVAFCLFCASIFYDNTIYPSSSGILFFLLLNQPHVQGTLILFIGNGIGNHFAVCKCCTVRNIKIWVLGVHCCYWSVIFFELPELTV
jgi:hypothetical protein